MSRGNKVTLKSSDGKTFELDKLVAYESQTLELLIEDICNYTIPLPNVSGKILSKVIEYCRYHVESQKIYDDELARDKIKQWDAEFMKVDEATLFLLMEAADYLNIKHLLDLTFQTAADNSIKFKSFEEIRILFGIENDFNPQEEEKVRRDNQWAFGPLHIF